MILKLYGFCVIIVLEYGGAGMDYNYVRMRDALKNGELEKSEEFKLLYEGAKEKITSIPVLNYIIVILACISLLLGVYILHSQDRMTNSENTTTGKVVASEVPDGNKVDK